MSLYHVRIVTDRASSITSSRSKPPTAAPPLHASRGADRARSLAARLA